MIYQILRHFVNTLTADDKHFLLNRNNLTPPIEMELSRKKKTFSPFFFFFCFFNIYIKFCTLSEKKWPWYLMYFWNYRLQKTWLDQCLKFFVSQDISINNIVNGSQNFCNMTNSTFTIFINHCEGNYVKIVSIKQIMLVFGTHCNSKQS